MDREKQRSGNRSEETIEKQNSHPGSSGKMKWHSLENPAKIFPATSGRRDERVFRLACELTEEVDPDALQTALDLSVGDYSLFLCVMRHGLFWNYLEETHLRPQVREESRMPCSQLYVRDQKNLLFEVTYYKKRINFETYHALTDGTGALQFMKTLLYYYLMQVHPKQVQGPISRVKEDAPMEALAEDGFRKYYSGEKSAEDLPKHGRSYQFGQKRLAPGSFQITEGILPVGKLLEKSREMGTTVTVYLTAVFLCAIAQGMDPKQRNKTVTLMVPVNLRNYFPSDSMRNFFGWINISYNFSTQSGELEEVIRYTSDFFKKELSKERIAARMNNLTKMEKNPIMRILPLPIKLKAMQAAASLSTGYGTAVLSNVGRITMPEECVPYIERFELYTTTPKMEICMCSWQDKMSISFTSTYGRAETEEHFFRSLTARGIPVEIIAWRRGEGEVDSSTSREKKVWSQEERKRRRTDKEEIRTATAAFQYCRGCGVTVRTPSRACPLCGGNLEGKAREENRLFPPQGNEEASKQRKEFRMFTYLCIAAALLAVFFNLFQDPGTFWARYVAAGAACTWLLTAAAIAKRRNLMKNALWQMVLLWGVFLFWDWLTGYRGWAVGYAFPAVWAVSAAAVFAVIRMEKPPLSYYMVYLFLLFAGSLLPGVLVLLGTVSAPLPSLLCVGAGICLAGSLLLFQRKTVGEELRKKLHL